jgi:hypothetical protein
MAGSFSRVKFPEKFQAVIVYIVYTIKMLYCVALNIRIGEPQERATLQSQCWVRISL